MIYQTKANLVNFSEYPLSLQWMENASKEVPNYDTSNGEGLKIFAEVIRNNSILNI